MLCFATQEVHAVLLGLPPLGLQLSLVPSEVEGKGDEGQAG